MPSPYTALTKVSKQNTVGSRFGYLKLSFAGLNVHFGDQHTLSKVVRTSSKQGFDIIIVDVSFLNEYQPNNLKSSLMPGGFYVVQDAQNSILVHKGLEFGTPPEGTKEKTNIYMLEEDPYREDLK